jgi:phage terminase Nu1 subunit (DNA packaging protein)
VKRKTPAFPRLNQTEMANFLGIKRVRLKWATLQQGIVERDADGFYRPEIATAQWLRYERQNTKISRRNELEQERVRLTRAKADAAERRLAQLDRSLVSTYDIVDLVKMVCLRIRNRLLTATPRLARACYQSPSAREATLAARREVDVLLAELAALDQDGTRRELKVVEDANGESNQLYQ